MKFDTKDLEQMSRDDLIKIYRGERKSGKKNILKSLANSTKFSVLMNAMTPTELEQMARIHPYKEVIIDTMINEMESHGTQMTKFFDGNNFQKESFNNFLDVLSSKSLFDRIKETFTRKPALPKALPKKIEQAKKLCEIEVRRKNATGKKVEQLETQDLGKAVDESRVEVNNGEMAKIFDRYAKNACKQGRFFDAQGETEVAKELKSQLTDEYKKILGNENEDIAQLIANNEFENYSGKSYTLPYSRGTFGAKPYDYNQSIGGTIDQRGWQKNLLEVEKVEDFTVANKNFGEVYIVKSEFSPTSYAIEGKWAPVYEYYTRDENGEFKTIGSGKINEQTGKMETTLSDTEHDVYFEDSEIEKGKQDGTIIQFDSNEYAGKTTKTSRKDIEQAITTKSINEYLGKGKQVADITQVKDIPVVNFDDNGYPHNKNAYIVAVVENGAESYQMVCIGEDGKCEKYPGMTQDMFAKKDLNFPTGMTTGYDKKSSLNLIDKKHAIETFKTREGMQYSAYRDKDGTLRVAQIMEHANGNGSYAEELDTYSLMHGDMEKIKEKSKNDYERNLTLLREEKSQKNGISLESKNDDSMEL